MPRPPRRYTLVCPECGADYHPHHRTQQTCSRSCGAARSYRLSAKRKTAWWQASIQTRRPRNVARLAEQIKGCKTLGDAYRLGFKKGYGQGYQAAERKRKRAA